MANAVHLAAHPLIESGEPFVVHYECLNFCRGEFGILGVGFRIQRGLGLLEPFLEVTFLVGEFQSCVKHSGLFLRLLFAPDLLEPGSDVRLGRLIEFGECVFLATVLLLKVSDSRVHGF